MLEVSQTFFFGEKIPQRLYYIHYNNHKDLNSLSYFIQHTLKANFMNNFLPPGQENKKVISKVKE